uniref:Uncharacterized protein n=1 Tax=Rhizophora mucronata TaxID=61149 RepID=A0A2P2J2Q1_RHIMU
MLTFVVVFVSLAIYSCVVASLLSSSPHL